MPDTNQSSGIEEYVRGLPDDSRRVVQRIRAIVLKLVPDVQETMRYGIPTFDVQGKHLLYVAAWKTHVALYPVPAGTPAFEKELAPYVKGKGTIRFPLNAALPYDLVERAVKFRVKDVRKAARAMPAAEPVRITGAER